MTVTSLDLLRGWLDGAPEGGVSRFEDQDSATPAQVANQMKRDLQRGDELRTWDDIDHHSSRVMPDEHVLEALRDLAQTDTNALVEVLSAAEPLAVYLLVQFADWNEDFCDRWVRARSSRVLAALGLLRWLRLAWNHAYVTSGTDIDALDDLLGRIGAALAARPRAEETALWWQVLGVAYRLCPMADPNMLKRMEAFYRHAGAALSRLGGADALPSAPDLALWASGNPDLLGVLPQVARQATEEARGTILAAFFADADRRLESDMAHFPDINRAGGRLYVSACGHAVALQAAVGVEHPWWRDSLRRFVKRLSGWKGDSTAVARERAAWVACAASIGALKLARVSDESWREIVDDLFQITAPWLPEWLWEVGFPSSARVALPELLARAVALDPGTAEPRIRMIAGAVVDSSTLRGIRNEAHLTLSPEYLAELDSRVLERAEFERQLGRTPSEREPLAFRRSLLSRLLSGPGPFVAVRSSPGIRVRGGSDATSRRGRPAQKVAPVK